MEKTKPGWSHLPPPPLSQAVVRGSLLIQRLMVLVSRLSLPAQVTGRKPGTTTMLLVIHMPVWLCSPHVKNTRPRSLSKVLRQQQEVRLDLRHGTYNVVSCGLYFRDDDVVVIAFTHTWPFLGTMGTSLQAITVKPQDQFRLAKKIKNFYLKLSQPSHRRGYVSLELSLRFMFFNQLLQFVTGARSSRDQSRIDSSTLTREWKR